MSTPSSLIFNPVITGKEKPSEDTPTIIFLSGFPDTQDSWSRLTPYFESDYHVIALCFPGFDKEDLSKDHFWGYDHTEIIDGLNDIIDPIIKIFKSKIVLVGHDWGSFSVQCYTSKYTENIHKMVLLDIGAYEDLVSFGIPLWVSLLQTSYMSYLALAFIISRMFSSKIANAMILLYPWFLIGPCPYESSTPIKFENIKSHTCYPYFHFFQMFLRRILPTPHRKNIDGISQLFCFGARKLWMFHSSRYLNRLSSSKNSSWYEFSESGHWLHWTHPAEVAGVMIEFIKKDV